MQSRQSRRAADGGHIEALLQSTVRSQESRHRPGIEWPAEVTITGEVMQDRYAHAITLVQFGIVLDADAFEIRRPGFGQHGNGAIAELAFFGYVESQCAIALIHSYPRISLDVLQPRRPGTGTRGRIDE